MTNKIVHAELFTKFCMFPSSLKQKLNVLLNLNCFILIFSHWHEEEIILLVLFYTLWDTFKYFIHDFFSWGSQVTNLEQSVIRAFLAGGTFTSRFNGVFIKHLQANPIIKLRWRWLLSRIGGFHVTSSPQCWWTVNKRLLISSFCLSTSICSFHHCYLCLLRLHENHL